MGHNLRAFIGRRNAVCELANDWRREATFLPQDFALLFLTDDLFDDITELADMNNHEDCSVLVHFTTAIAQVMEMKSFRTSLAYIETDYFGGYGTQAGVLYADGKIDIRPTKDENIINVILQRLGVYQKMGWMNLKAFS